MKNFTFQILLLLPHIGLGLDCGGAEYKIGNECCPMCTPGTRIKEHCTEFTSTSCIPCTDSTYLDQPNGEIKCFECSLCDQVVGLRVKQPCTSTSDAVCEPLNGFYCKHPTQLGCEVAQEHQLCKPGQYIRQPGTSSKDTVCSDCTGDTFSNGSLTSCQHHIECESLGLVQINPGTHSADTQCGEPPTRKRGVGVIVTIVIILLGLVVLIIYILSKKVQKRKQTKDSSSSPSA